MSVLAPCAAPAPVGVAAGSGRVTVAGSGPRSVVTGAFATSPLRLLTPKNHGRAAWVFTSSYGGGMVDGDRTALDVVVGEHAAAFVSTQAATKIYPSPSGTAAALRATVGRGGVLVLVPDLVVCFAGARYQQVQQVDLHADATLVLVDWVSSGRLAFGERWAFSEYESRLRIRSGSRLLVHDAIALRASDGRLPERLGRFHVLATVVLFGPLVRMESGRIVSEVAARPIEPRADMLEAATPLGDDGCVVKLAATSVEQARAALHRLLRCVPQILEDDPWARKW